MGSSQRRDRDPMVWLKSVCIVLYVFHGLSWTQTRTHHPELSGDLVVIDCSVSQCLITFTDHHVIDCLMIGCGMDMIVS